MKQIYRWLMWLLILRIDPGSEWIAHAADKPAEEQLQVEELSPPAKEKRRSRQRSKHESRSDVVTMGNDVVIKEDEVKRDVVVIGGSATVDGTVTGDLVVILGAAKLGPKAEVNGDVTVVGGISDIDSAAKIAGTMVNLGIGGSLERLRWLRWPQQWALQGLFWGRPLAPQYWWSWGLAAVFLVLYLITAALFPRPIQATNQALAARPASSFLLGLLAFLIIGPLMLLMLLSVVGIILIPFLMVSLLIAFFFGKIAVYQFAGLQIGSRTGLAALQSPWLALIIGAAVFYLLYAVPILGFVVWGLIATLALGAALLAFCKSFRAESAAARVGLSPAPPPPAPVGEFQTGSQMAGNLALLPRVGFWWRFFATLLDLLLAVLLLRLFDPHPGRVAPVFMLIWLIYHIGMWTWKGATIGDLALGIKLIRKDGGQVDFATALVRILGSFFSAVALFLGFFWAGWDREKQSWHDKIAGTIIVKMPKGTPSM
jgi:uncharacterized RDD family membrane protein YckC